MTTTNVLIPTPDGFDLSGIFYEYDRTPKAVVQFNIGTGMRKEFYSNMATFLANNGFIVCLWEYRGMGQSRPSDKDTFTNITMQDWAADMSAVLEYLNRRYPDWPKLMIGHSIGGQLIGLMPNHHLLKGAALLTVSTGTWWHHTFPYRLVSFFFFNIVTPLTLPFWDYLPAKRLRIMEDLPKALINEWRTWCNSENYLFDFLDKSIFHHYYDEVRIPIKSYWTTDDPIANAHSVPALLRHYQKADIVNETIIPQDYGLKKIGHFGLFSRKMQTTFWPKLVADLEILLLKNHPHQRLELQ